jgi:predicted NBD/HSP70 family sugar kinase
LILSANHQELGSFQAIGDAGRRSTKAPMAAREGDISAIGQTRFKRRNRMAIVRLVKEHPGISRAEVVERSGLTKGTVSILSQELLDDGWLSEGESVAGPELGRPRTPLTLGGERLALLGAAVGIDAVQVVACNLLGAVLDSRQLPRGQKDARGTAALLARLVSEAHGVLVARGFRALGLAVAVPGVVEADASRVRVAPTLGWRSAAVGELLREALAKRRLQSLPVTILNDARAAALGQYVFGEERHVEPLVYLSLGMTVGAGIVVGGRLQIGHNSLAGQVGHVVLERGGRPCVCGRRGCAETLISQPAISRLVTGKESPVLSVRELTDRLARGDGQTAEVLAQAGRNLGFLMLDLGSTLNPAEFVLGGPLARILDPFVMTAIETLRAELGSFDHEDVLVRICRFGPDAGAVGAAASVLQDAVSDPG